MINLRNVDLNLLVVLDTIYRERHVTRAAKALGMSQPAVSNALSRLRHMLGDSLFVRTPQGLQATERADDIAGLVRTLLKDAEDIFDPETFDSREASGVITVAAVDLFNTAILPTCVELLRNEAPGITLRVIPTGGAAFRLLDTGEADIALASFSTPPKRFRKRALLKDDYICLVGRSHPAAKNGLNLRDYAYYGHILHNPAGDLRGTTDKKLEDAGLKRHIAVTINSFWAAGPLLEKNNLILTAPSLAVQCLLETWDLVTLPCPVPSDPGTRQLEMLWHTRLGERPLSKWFREKLGVICDDIASAI
jgi:DNA-binding transcriptional LysR family regulator